MVILKNKNGDKILVVCLTNFTNPNKCHEYHQGALGCPKDCSVYIKATKTNINSFLEIRNELEWEVIKK